MMPQYPGTIVRNPEMIQQLRSAVLAALEALVCPMVAVYVHGFYATPSMRGESDTDLAILCGQALVLHDRL